MTNRSQKKSPHLVERERLVRRLIKRRKLLGETWRVDLYPRLKNLTYDPHKDAMHLVLKETPISRDIACFYYGRSYGATIAIGTAGPADPTGYPGRMPNAVMQVEVAFNGVDIENGFDEIYATALEMWRAGSATRERHNGEKRKETNA